MPLYNRVAVVGRFQPFHWGHFEYVMEAARLGSSLLVAVTNPTCEQVLVSDLDAARSAPEANPFSYDLRCAMIAASLSRLAPWLRHQFAPCDLSSRARIRHTLGACDTVAITIYDDWGREKKRILESAGLRVVVLWVRRHKLVTGTQVREQMETGLDWEHLVPPGVAEILRSAAEL